VKTFLARAGRLVLTFVMQLILRSKAKHLRFQLPTSDFWELVQPNREGCVKEWTSRVRTYTRQSKLALISSNVSMPYRQALGVPGAEDELKASCTRPMMSPLLWYFEGRGELTTTPPGRCISRCPHRSKQRCRHYRYSGRCFCKHEGLDNPTSRRSPNPGNWRTSASFRRS